MPYMKFLSVRPDVCRRLPSDSTSRWTPLPLAMRFPLLGLARDLHPLANAHAERTKHNLHPVRTDRMEIVLSDYISLICKEKKLLHYLHFVDKAFATSELLYYEKHVSDIYVYATLFIVVEVDVAAERFPVAVEGKTYKFAL